MTTVVGPKCSSRSAEFLEATAHVVMKIVGVTPKPSARATPVAISMSPRDARSEIAAE